jgi:hypothetical protein
MNKKIRKPLTLCRETLLGMQEPELYRVKAGTESIANGCTVSPYPVRTPCR